MERIDQGSAQNHQQNENRDASEKHGRKLSPIHSASGRKNYPNGAHRPLEIFLSLPLRIIARMVLPFQASVARVEWSCCARFPLENHCIRTQKARREKPLSHLREGG